MKEIRKLREIIPAPFADCHDGEGTLLCRSLLDGLGSSKFPFMHSDEMPAGVSIGVHSHTENEEIVRNLNMLVLNEFYVNQYEMGAASFYEQFESRISAVSEKIRMYR